MRHLSAGSKLLKVEGPVGNHQKLSLPGLNGLEAHLSDDLLDVFSSARHLDGVQEPISRHNNKILDQVKLKTRYYKLQTSMLIVFTIEICKLTAISMRVAI